MQPVLYRQHENAIPLNRAKFMLGSVSSAAVEGDVELSLACTTKAQGYFYGDASFEKVEL